jgi:HEAT repeat protein
LRSITQEECAVLAMRGSGRRHDTGLVTRIDTAGEDEVGRRLRQVADRSVETAWRLDMLLDLGRIADPRVVAVLLGVLSDCSEPVSVRLAVLRHLRDRSDTHMRRTEAAEVLRRLVRDRRTNLALRGQAALALGDYTDLRHVVADLGAVCGEATDSFDVRYAAFISLQCAGPTPECIALLRRISEDETLGQSARSILASWRSA